MTKSYKSLRAWREEGFVYRLPSAGVEVRLRRVALDQLVAAGQIPDFLTPMAYKVLFQQLGGPEPDFKSDAEFIQLVNIIATAALLEPRIVDNPQADDEIALEDLDFGDRTAIYMIAKQPLEVLHRFRASQTGDVATVEDSQGNGAKAIEPVTDSGATVALDSATV
jgi:hypothetical protein